MGRLVNLFPLAFGLEHGPRRGDRGSRQQASDSFPGGCCSSAERLSKLTVSGDHTKPVSSDLACARTSAIATASATAKAMFDDSVKRACVELPYEDVSRISVLPFPTSLNKSDGAQQFTHSLNLQCPTFSYAATTVVQRAYDLPRGCPVRTIRSAWHSTVPQHLTGPRPPA